VRKLFVMMLIGVLSFAAFSLVVGSGDESGGESDPIRSPAVATTEAVVSAISVSDIDHETCDGVLAPAAGDFSLDTQSLTESAKDSRPQVLSMCSAAYKTGVQGGEFLTIALMQFDSDDSAIDYYEFMKNVFIASDVPISEINSAAEGLIDQLSALMEHDGVGRISIFRQREWLITVSAGPTMEDLPWPVDDIEMIGRGVLDRVK